MHSLKFVIIGSFNIGVSLHACGVATDLVIQKCIENKASFVSCPCCYGSVQENHMVSYPRSQIFKEVPIAFKVSFSWDYTSELLDETFRVGPTKLKKIVSNYKSYFLQPTDYRDHFKRITTFHFWEYLQLSSFFVQ